MFDSIRKHQRLLQFLLLLLIFPAFAFFGVSGYQKFLGDEDSVASVSGSRIDRQEFDQARRRQLDQLRQVLGPQADAKLLDTPEMTNEILDSLISRRALLLEAERQRITVTDERLRDAIGAISGLRRPDGGFDMERYRALLSAQGLSEQMFEAQTRFDLALQALPDALASSSIVPRTVLERLVALQEQVRETRELLFKPADFASRANPTDEQLRKHYEANLSAFETPESAKVEYLVLAADALESQVTLGEDDLRTYYEQNRSRYAAPDERRASHLLVKLDPGAGEEARKAARARADALLAQARAGGDFAALAKANSQDPGSAANGGDLGWFSRETMVKPFADAAFALKEGELSGVVESEFGFHVIKLTGVKAGSQRPFEQVRPELEAELRKQQAGKRFAEAADTFSNMVYEQADSLQPAAERFKLKIQTAADVTRSGVGESKPASPLSNPKLLAALFSADSVKTKRNTEAIDLGGNTLVSARIVEHRPAQRKPYEQVRDEVRARVVDELARKLAREAGESRLKGLRGGEGADGFSEPRRLSRTAQPAIAAAAMEAVFRAPVDKLPAYVGVDLGAQGYGVYQVVSISQPAEAEVAKRLPQYAQQLAQVEGQQAVTDFIESVKARSKVQRHPERIVAKGETR